MPAQLMRLRIAQCKCSLTATITTDKLTINQCLIGKCNQTIQQETGLIIQPTQILLTNTTTTPEFKEVDTKND